MVRCLDLLETMLGTNTDTTVTGLLKAIRTSTKGRNICSHEQLISLHRRRETHIECQTRLSPL